MDRRTFSLAAMAMTGVSLSPQKGWSYGQCDVGTQELEIGLAKFPSRGVGSQSHRRLAYVLVSPWCPQCRQLVEAALSGSLDFSVRAIPSSLRSVDHVRKAAGLILDDSFRPMDFFGRPVRSNFSDEQLQRVNSAVQYTKFSVEQWGIRFRNLGQGTPIWAARQTDGFNTFLGFGTSQISFWNDYFRSNVSTSGIRPDEGAMALSRRFLMNGFRGEIRNTWHGVAGNQRKLRVLPVDGALSPECVDRNGRMAGEARFSYAGESWVLFRGQLGYSGERSGWFEAFGKESDFPFQSYA